MQISEQGLALIKEFEAFSALPYRCPAGKLTIGYGHVVTPPEDYATGINEAQATQLLQNDTAAVGQAIARLVHIPLAQCQFDALVALAYNIGIGAFSSSTLLNLLNKNDIAAAAGQFSRWVYAHGERLDGLVRRRAAEAALFCGQSQSLC